MKRRRTHARARNDLTIAPTELADMLGIKPDTLRKWRKRGRGPAFVSETPRSTVYLRATVENWLRANQQSQA
jgi:hypothetical protein